MGPPPVGLPAPFNPPHPLFLPVQKLLDSDCQLCPIDLLFLYRDQVTPDVLLEFVSPVGCAVGGGVHEDLG